MVVGLFVSVWVARYLGVEQFGLFSYATAFVALFSTLSTLGLPSLVIRTITHEPEKREQILGTTFWLQLFGGITALVLAVGTMSVLRQGDQLMLSLVSLLASASIFKAFETIDVWFQAQVQSKYAVLAKNTAFLTVTIVKVILINIQAPMLAFAGATLAEAILGALGLILAYRIQGYSLWLWRWSLSLAKMLLRESGSLILSGFTIMVYIRMDQLMLGEMLGDQAVGLYSSVVRITESWYFIPMALTSSVAPSIYKAKKELHESLYYRQIEQLLRVLSSIAILIALPMTFMSETIITHLFGNDYSAAGPILAIHIWASLFVFTGFGTSSWFIAEELTHLEFRRTLIGAIINVILNFVLIPAYGGVGAAIATVIAQAYAYFLSNALHPKTRKLFQAQLKSFMPVSIKF
jgi:PST family polysaccharide transporter